MGNECNDQAIIELTAKWADFFLNEPHSHFCTEITMLLIYFRFCRGGRKKNGQYLSLWVADNCRQDKHGYGNSSVFRCFAKL